MTNMSIQPLWLTHFIEILLVLEFQLTKTYFCTFSYKAHFTPQISSNVPKLGRWSPFLQPMQKSHGSPLLGPERKNFHQPCLIFVGSSISKKTGPKHPHALNQFPSQRKRNQLPSSVFLKRIHLFIHGNLPSRIVPRMVVGFWV